MPIQFVSGNIFVNTYTAQAFDHGCNCQGSMGAGIAKEFKARYLQIFSDLLSQHQRLEAFFLFAAA